MAVGRAPAWNINNNEFGIERELEGPPSEDPGWNPDVDTIAFSIQAKQFKMDRLAANNGRGNPLVKGFLRLAAEAESLMAEPTEGELADDPFHSIYFTNYRKDGEFDSTDGGLNEKYDFWEPVLAQEIELLQPKVILTFGQAVTQRVARIVNNVDMPETSFRPQDACLELLRSREPYILPSIHWGE